MALVRIRFPFDASQFQWGMEDGIIYGERVIIKNDENFADKPQSEKHPGYPKCADSFFEGPQFYERWFRPYIETFRGKVIIKNETDWIITNLNGDREVNTNEEFQDIYEFI